MHRNETPIAVHSPAMLIWLSTYALSMLWSIHAVAQDTMRLRSFPGGHVIFAPANFVSISEKNKWSYQYAANLNVMSDTGALNARYRPSLNPLLRWKDSYPLTPEEMERRSAVHGRNAKLGNQVLDGAVNRLLRRNKQIAVKPTF